MSGNWKDRDAWLMDENAMLDWFDGPACVDCGYRGDECICKNKQQGNEDAETESQHEEEARTGEMVQAPKRQAGTQATIRPERHGVSGEDSGDGQTMNFHLAILPPKATHQGSSMIMKRKDGSSFVGRPGNSPGAKAKKSLVQLLMAHAPEKPLEGPLRVSILVVWPWRKSEPKYRKALRAAPHFVKPDLDNYAKLLLDALADAAFFATGDQQVSHLNLSKAWADQPGIHFTIEPDETE